MCILNQIKKVKRMDTVSLFEYVKTHFGIDVVSLPNVVPDDFDLSKKFVVIAANPIISAAVYSHITKTHPSNDVTVVASGFIYTPVSYYLDKKFRVLLTDETRILTDVESRKYPILMVFPSTTGEVVISEYDPDYQLCLED